MSTMSDAVRQQFKAGDDVRDAGLVTPASIRRFDDIAYGPDVQWQKLTSIVPKTFPLQLRAHAPRRRCPSS